jgi:hypothetical protein
MKNKYTILFIIYFLIFFFLIFFINLFFFTSNVDKEYEDTVDSYEEKTSLNTAKSLSDDFLDIDKKTQNTDDVKNRYNEILKEYKNNVLKKEAETSNKSVVDLIFSPENLESLLVKQSKVSPITLFIYSKIISSKPLDFSVSFFQNSD